MASPISIPEENIPMGRAEGYVENYLVKKAKEKGFLCFKFTSPGIRGVPDRIVIGHGKTVFIETKSKTGTPSELQKIRIKQLKDHGAEVYIASSREQIDQILETI